MLLNSNKKKIATLIVGSMGKPKDDFVQKMGEPSKTGSFEVPEKEEEDESSAALESAMGDFLRAVDGKNPKGMAQSLKDAVYLCQDSDSEPKDEAE